MPQLAGVNWYNENQYRDYPFQERKSPRALPVGLIVDCGVVTPRPAKVWLSKISRENFNFEITIEGEDLDTPLVFNRDILAKEYTEEWADSKIEGNCAEQLQWYGFLVTGDMQLFEELLPAAGEVNFTENDAVLEQACVTALTNLGVNSINLANFDRTYVAAPADCETGTTPLSNELIVNARCLQGVIEFTEGHNLTIQQSDTENGLILSAGLGDGLGIPCAELPLTEDQVPLPGSDYLSGGPSCGDLLRAINGVPGPVVNIIGLSGVQVFPHETEPHTLVIDFTGKNAVNCATALAFEEYESSSSSAAFDPDDDD